MTEQSSAIARAVISAVSAVAKGSAGNTVRNAYQNLKIKIAEALGAESDLLDVVTRLEKKPDSAGVKLQLEEEFSELELAQHPQVVAALQPLLKAGDRIEIDAQGDVVLAKDQATSVMIKNLTVHPDGKEPETLRRLYLQALASETNHLPWASVDKDYADPNRGENLELVHIYTAQDTTELEKLATEDAVRKYLSRQKEARRISAQKMIDTRPKLVLLGDPGCGKSTLVNYLSFVMAQAGIGPPDEWLARLEQSGPWNHGVMLPVRVVLRDFAASLFRDDDAGRDDPLLHYIQSTLKIPDFRQILYESLLDPKTPCLLLLDGLDEVPAECRKQVVRIIDAFAARYKANRFLVTCRIYAYVGQDYQLSGFHQATLTPFSPEQIERFIGAWYHELHKRGRFTESEAKTRAEKLKAAATRPDLVGLAERPLLTTVMALLHTFRGQLPDDRVELYQWTVDLLLRRWESRHGEEKGLLDTLGIPNLKMTDLEAGLYAVAFDVHSGDTGEGDAGDIREADLRERLAPYLNHDWNKAGEFVEYVRDRAGLLIRHKPSAYTFPHRTFQEFMAACHLVGMADYPLEAARRVGENPDRWRIVFILAAGYAARTHRLGLAISSVSALCPEGIGETECAGAPGYRLAVIAGEALLEIGLVGVRRETIGATVLRRIQKWLLAAMEADADLKPTERVEAGNVLSRLGDPRFNPAQWHLPDDGNFGFVEIPAGSFQMGSDKGKDPQAEDHEFPMHAVMLSAFEISRYPVTVAQYRLFAQKTGREMDDDWRKYNRFDNHPVVEVDWHDAVAYCEWLTKKLNADGQSCRITLPTEAQWEKAARGGDGRIFPWGDEPDSNRMNHGETGIGTTSPVGCFPGGKTPYGLLDMAGNVDEWCLDDMREYTDEMVTDPHGDGAGRVIRGGSWYFPAEYCRSAYRDWGDPGYRYRYLGFRLVRLPGQPGEPSKSSK